MLLGCGLATHVIDNHNTACHSYYLWDPSAALYIFSKLTLSVFGVLPLAVFEAGWRLGLTS